MGFAIRDGVLTRYTDEPGVTEIAVPETVQEIGKWAFNNSKLEGIVLPLGAELIGEDAFRFCLNLRRVILPETVTGFHSFDKCRNLRGITVLVQDGRRTTAVYTRKDITLGGIHNAAELERYADIFSMKFRSGEEDPWPMLQRLYRAKEPTAAAYLRVLLPYLLRALIKRGDEAGVSELMHDSSLITNDNIDGLLAVTAELNLPELQQLLLQHRGEQSADDLAAKFAL